MHERWKMKTPELSIPESDFNVLKSLGAFCLLQNPESKFCKEIDIDSSVKVKILADEDFFDEPQGEPTDIAFFDIQYIRTTRIKNIIKPEWKIMYGPQNIPQYLRYNPKESINSVVNIVYLDPISYDLKQLRKEYRDPSIYGR
jgi:hypothetical protein